MSGIQLEQQSGILTIKLNRPEKLNAMRRRDFRELSSIIEKFRDSDDLKVLILTGNGRGFCAGEDLYELEQEGGVDPETMTNQLQNIQYITELLVGLDKPTICAINGPAVGFGFEVSLACDIRIASEAAYFWFSELKRGLLPTNAAFYLLPRLIGLGPATHLMLSAEKTGAEKARELGIVSTVTSPDDLLPSATKMALSLLDNSQIATQLSLQILRQSYDMNLHGIMDLEIQGTLKLASENKTPQGVKSFTQSK